MLRRLGIRGKVLAALAVPVLVLFAAATIISWQSIGSAREARSVSELVGAADELSSFARALQTERLVSLAFVADPEASAGRWAAARAGTDDAAARLDAAIASIDVKPLGSTVVDTLAQSATVRASLPALRAAVDSTQITRADVDTRYTSMIAFHVEQTGTFAAELADRELARYLDAYGLVSEAEERLVHELPAAMLVLRSDGSEPRAVLDLAPVVTLDTAAYTRARDAVNSLHLVTQLPILDAGYYSQRLQLSAADGAAVASVDPGTFEKRSLDALQEIAAVSDDVSGRGGALAAAKQQAEVRATTLTISVALATLLLSILVALLIAHQIISPLRRLTAAADDVSAQLPSLVEQVAVPGAVPELSLVQIPVTSRDEVGRLATAFNEVNATTIAVAQEQAALRGSIAEMFVNVARRDQVLLNRQISFIDALERSEEDPATLANLFRLDHLATRMRRNAESLLVLAGIDSGRRVRAAMPLSDVIRTASSEIELYERIELELGVDPNMHGFSALAAAHLLAELLENATMFSEPGTPVEVETSDADGHLLVVVHDHGIGMSDVELAAVNDRIRLTTASEMLGAQRLGFYVVGRLAARLGADVTLRRGQDGIGTDAVVLFPASIFEADDVARGPATPVGPGAARLPRGSLTAPEVLPVDLSLLTDGATPIGLPRRRSTSASAVRPAETRPAETRPAAAQLPRPARGGDGDIVLPLPTEFALSPELSDVPADWTPAVRATASSASILPSRSTPVEHPLPAPVFQTPRTSDPEHVSGHVDVPTLPVRGGLFAGFRGSAAGPSTRTDPTGPVEPVIPDFAIPELVADGEQWSPERPAEPPVIQPQAPAVPRSPSHRATQSSAPAKLANPAAPRGRARRVRLPEPALEPSTPAMFVPAPNPPLPNPPLPNPSPPNPRAGHASTSIGSMTDPLARASDETARTVATSWQPAHALDEEERAHHEPALDEVEQPASSGSAGPDRVAPTTVEPSPRRGLLHWLHRTPPADGPARPLLAGSSMPGSSDLGPVPPGPASPGPAPLGPAPLGQVSPGSVPLGSVPPKPVKRAPAGPTRTRPPSPDARQGDAPPSSPVWPALAAPRPSGAAPLWSAPSAAPPSPDVARAASPGVLDEQVAAMLALRSDIQEQALAEFSQLSAYRPNVVGNGNASGNGSGGSLQRRVPGVIPVAPPIVLPREDGAPARDAEQLRVRLASFQSGAARGRRATSSSDESPHTTDSDNPPQEDE